MNGEIKEMFEEVQGLFEYSSQNWLFGAGISCESNIPLMYPLTKIIEKNMSHGSYNTDFQTIQSQLNEGSHIEHFLSQISDIITLINRTGKTDLAIGSITFNLEKLDRLYKEIIKNIGEIIRYGYQVS
jgi:hypothetical protein